MSQLFSSRRSFFKKLILAIGSIPAASLLLSACTKKESEALPEGQKELSEADPVAQALGYKHDATQVDTSKFPKKAGADGANQKCENCAQYKAANGSWGKCAIFAQGLVKSKGWCNSWVAKN